MYTRFINVDVEITYITNFETQWSIDAKIPQHIFRTSEYHSSKWRRFLHISTPCRCGPLRSPKYSTVRWWVFLYPLACPQGTCPVHHVMRPLRLWSSPVHRWLHASPVSLACPFWRDGCVQVFVFPQASCHVPSFLSVCLFPRLYPLYVATLTSAHVAVDGVLWVVRSASYSSIPDTDGRSHYIRNTLRVAPCTIWEPCYPLWTYEMICGAWGSFHYSYSVGYWVVINR